MHGFCGIVGSVLQAFRTDFHFFMEVDLAGARVKLSANVEQNDRSQSAHRDAHVGGHPSSAIRDRGRDYPHGRWAGRGGQRPADTIVIPGSGSTRSLGYPSLSTAFEFGKDGSLSA